MNYIVVSENAFGGDVLAIFRDRKNAENYKTLREGQLNLNVQIIEKAFADDINAEAEVAGAANYAMLTCDKCSKIQYNFPHKHCTNCDIYCCTTCCQDVLCEICGREYENIN